MGTWKAEDDIDRFITRRVKDSSTATFPQNLAFELYNKEFM